MPIQEDTDPGYDPAYDWKGFYDQFQKESPRASVILAAAFLDERLRKILQAFMIDHENSIVDLIGSDKGTDRPLSTFSGRTRAAYCLGLISKDEFDDLNLIRRIRNRFAHRLHDISFDDKEISDWCYSLKIPQEIFEKTDIEKTHKEMYLVGVSLLASQLGLRELRASKERRQILSSFKVANLKKNK